MRNTGKKIVKSPAFPGDNMESQRKSPRKKLAKPTEKSKRKLEFNPEKKKKPFQGHKFFLDIQLRTKALEVKKRIESLGGVVEEFLSKDIKMVVTSQKLNNGTNVQSKLPSPMSAGPSPLPIMSSRHPMVQTQSPFSTDSPQHSVESTKKGKVPATETRGKQLLDLISKRGSGSSNIVSKATKLGVKLVNVDEFIKRYISLKKNGHLKSLISSLQSKQSLQIPKTSRLRTVTEVKIIKLQGTYFKVEDKSKAFRPIVHETKAWPKIYTQTSSIQSPFDLPKNVISEKNKTCDAELEDVTVSLEASEEKHGEEKVDVKAETPCRDHCKAHPSKPGYCDCCSIRYQDLHKHLKSDLHVKFAKDPSNFKKLDELILRGTNFFDFLQIMKDKAKEKLGIKTENNKFQDAKPGTSDPLISDVRDCAAVKTEPETSVGPMKTEPEVNEERHNTSETVTLKPQGVTVKEDDAALFNSPSRLPTTKAKTLTPSRVKGNLFKSPASPINRITTPLKGSGILSLSPVSPCRVVITKADVSEHVNDHDVSISPRVSRISAVKSRKQSEIEMESNKSSNVNYCDKLELEDKISSGSHMEAEKDQPFNVLRLPLRKQNVSTPKRILPVETDDIPRLKKEASVFASNGLQDDSLKADDTENDSRASDKKPVGVATSPSIRRRTKKRNRRHRGSEPPSSSQTVASQESQKEFREILADEPPKKVFAEENLCIDVNEALDVITRGRVESNVSKCSFPSDCLQASDDNDLEVSFNYDRNPYLKELELNEKSYDCPDCLNSRSIDHVTPISKSIPVSSTTSGDISKVIGVLREDHGSKIKSEQCEKVKEKRSKEKLSRVNEISKVNGSETGSARLDIDIFKADDRGEPKGVKQKRSAINNCMDSVSAASYPKPHESKPSLQNFSIIDTPKEECVEDMPEFSSAEQEQRCFYGYYDDGNESLCDPDACLDESHSKARQGASHSNETTPMPIQARLSVEQGTHVSHQGYSYADELVVKFDFSDDEEDQCFQNELSNAIQTSFDKENIGVVHPENFSSADFKSLEVLNGSTPKREKRRVRQLRDSQKSMCNNKTDDSLSTLNVGVIDRESSSTTDMKSVEILKGTTPKREKRRVKQLRDSQKSMCNNKTDDSLSTLNVGVIDRESSSTTDMKSVEILKGTTPKREKRRVKQLRDSQKSMCNNKTDDSLSTLHVGVIDRESSSTTDMKSVEILKGTTPKRKKHKRKKLQVSPKTRWNENLDHSHSTVDIGAVNLSGAENKLLEESTGSTVKREKRRRKLEQSSSQQRAANVKGHVNSSPTLMTWSITQNSECKLSIQKDLLPQDCGSESNKTWARGKGDRGNIKKRTVTPIDKERARKRSRTSCSQSSARFSANDDSVVPNSQKVEDEYKENRLKINKIYVLGGVTREEDNDAVPGDPKIEDDDVFHEEIVFECDSLNTGNGCIDFTEVMNTFDRIKQKHRKASRIASESLSRSSSRSTSPAPRKPTHHKKARKSSHKTSNLCSDQVSSRPEKSQDSSISNYDSSQRTVTCESYDFHSPAKQKLSDEVSRRVSPRKHSQTVHYYNSSKRHKEKRSNAYKNIAKQTSSRRSESQKSNSKTAKNSSTPFRNPHSKEGKVPSPLKRSFEFDEGDFICEPLRTTQPVRNRGKRKAKNRGKPFEDSSEFYDDSQMRDVYEFT